MATEDEFDENLNLIKSDRSVVFLYCFGIILFIGGIALILETPIDFTFAVGMSFIAFGAALVIFSFNRFSNVKLKRKLSEINEKLKKLDAIENSLKKIEDSLKKSD
jgi:uncharacterized membrane protein